MKGKATMKDGNDKAPVATPRIEAREPVELSDAEIANIAAGGCLD
jgi:hypothetical protein